MMDARVGVDFPAAQRELTRLDAVAEAEEAFRGAIAGDERRVALVHVARDELCRVRVGARNEHRWHIRDVGRETSCRQRALELSDRDEDLAAEVAALLL